MLDNTITLPVDVLNNGTTVNKLYTRDEEYVNRSVYTGPAHTLTARDTITFYRQPVKRNGAFLGQAKSAFKLTEDLTVLNAEGANITQPAVVDVACSFPVGITPAKALEMRQRTMAVLDHAIAASLTEKLQI